MDERTTAFHEAAHAVVGLVLGIPIRSVTITPAADYLGQARPGDAPADVPPEAWVTFVMAGPEGERKCTGLAPRGHLGDHGLAFDLLTEGRWTPETLEREAREARLRAAAHVEEHWKWIGRVAAALQHRRTLTGAQVAALYCPRE